MSTQVNVLDGEAALTALASEWPKLIREDAHELTGLDATNGPIWFDALRSAFAPARDARVVVVREQGELAGLLPLIRDGQGYGCQALRTASELYAGRSGFMLRRDDPKLLAALLGGVTKAFGRWQTLSTMVVVDGASARLLAQVLPTLGMQALHFPGWPSPWFELQDEAKAFDVGVSKSLRQTIRTATNKLRTQGSLSVTSIEDEGLAEAALADIFAIDSQSWKQQAGTAITCHAEQQAFYRALFPQALRDGLLYGQILRLDGAPIAFNFGLVSQGVYSCLKHSQTLAQQANSPSQVLNSMLIESLRARGVRRYDFMGRVEPHKMRWSSQTSTYMRHPIRIYSDSPCGRVAHGLQRMKDKLRKWRRSTVDSAAEPADE